LKEILDVYRNGGLEGLRSIKEKAAELEAIERVEKQNKLQEDLTAREELIKELVQLTKDAGGDVTDVQDLLKDARRLWSAGELEDARTQMLKAGKLADQKRQLQLRTEILEELEAARSVFLKLKELGADVAKLGSAIVAASNALEKGELEKARTFSTGALNILGAVSGPWMSNLVLSNIHDLKERHQRGVAEDREIPGLVVRIEEALAKAEAGDLSGALLATARGFGKVHREELEESTRGMQEQVVRLSEQIEELEESGVDMKVARDIHGGVVQSLRRAKMTVAEKGLANLTRLVEEIQGDFSRERARETMASVEALLAHLHRHAPRSMILTANGEVILKNARNMMGKGSYAYADRYALSAREFLLSIEDEEVLGLARTFMFGHVEQLQKDLKELLGYLKEQNLPEKQVAIVQRNLEEAAELARDGARLSEAEALLLKGKASGLRMKNDYLRNRIVPLLKKLTALVEEGRRAGKDTSAVEAACSSARKYMKTREFEKALAQLEGLSGK
jgi:hypothetical protein